MFRLHEGIRKLSIIKAKSHLEKKSQLAERNMTVDLSELNAAADAVAELKAGDLQDNLKNVDEECVINICACFRGRPHTGPQCAQHGTPSCRVCDAGYKLNDGPSNSTMCVYDYGS